MESSDKTSKSFNGTVHLEYLPCVNYAMIHNHVPAFSFCELINNDEIDWNEVKISISGELIKYSDCVLDIVPQGQNI